MFSWKFHNIIGIFWMEFLTSWLLRTSYAGSRGVDSVASTTQKKWQIKKKRLWRKKWIEEVLAITRLECASCRLQPYSSSIRRVCKLDGSDQDNRYFLRNLQIWSPDSCNFIFCSFSASPTTSGWRVLSSSLISPILLVKDVQKEEEFSNSVSSSISAIAIPWSRNSD